MSLLLVEPSCLAEAQHYCRPQSWSEVPRVEGALRETKEGRLGHLRASYLVPRR